MLWGVSHWEIFRFPIKSILSAAPAAIEAPWVGCFGVTLEGALLSVSLRPRICQVIRPLCQGARLWEGLEKTKLPAAKEH